MDGAFVRLSHNLVGGHPSQSPPSILVGLRENKFVHEKAHQFIN
jgi:hypothetical protein